jgi:hypothetical protein
MRSGFPGTRIGSRPHGRPSLPRKVPIWSRLMFWRTTASTLQVPSVASQSTSTGGDRNQVHPLRPLSHPFVERLIGTIRREYLDHTLFWTTTDLENKLLDFRAYFNNHRTHNSLGGRTPDTPLSRPVANLQSFRWQPRCRALYQTPVAA